MCLDELDDDAPVLEAEYEEAQVQQYELHIAGRKRPVTLSRELVETHASLTVVSTAKIVSVPTPPDPARATDAGARAAALRAGRPPRREATRRRAPWSRRRRR